MWDLYLHRVFDKSYAEFREEQNTIQDNQNMSATQIETTLLHTNNILNNFNPET